MEKKIVVGIDINEIIRGRWQKFDQCYIQEFGDDGISEPFNTYEWRNHYEFKDKVEVIEVMNESALDDVTNYNPNEILTSVPSEYVLNEKTGKAPIDDFIFKKETSFLSADEVYKKFLYETYGFEIFAAAPPFYKHVDLDIQKFFKKYRKNVDLRIVSKENVLSIPFTLSFLSRVRTRFSSYHFSEDNAELWSHVDVMITTDPSLVAAKPDGKKVIKMTREWNVGQPCDMEKINVIDLYDSKEFQSMVGYVEPTEEIIEETKEN